MNPDTLFGKHQFSRGTEKFFPLGKIHLGIRREKEGWYILQMEDNKDKKPDEANITEGEYYHSGKSNSLVIVPALPLKPLVFKGNKMFVAPRQKLMFFIKIPLTIHIYFSKNQPENLLKEINCERLSDTWFGEPDLGEPAFSLGSSFYLNQEEADTTPFEAVCPVSLFNNSPQILEVERLIIRVENLALYKNSDKAITSLVQIEYKGKDIISSASFHYSKNIHGEKQEIISKPRNTSGLGLLRNFHFIKQIYKSEL